MTWRRRKVMKTVHLVVFFCTLISADARELRLLGMLPTSGQGWVGGSSCYVSVAMALEDINANENILKDYNLTYNWYDSKVRNLFTFQTLVKTVFLFFQKKKRKIPFIFCWKVYIVISMPFILISWVLFVCLTIIHLQSICSNDISMWSCKMHLKYVYRSNQACFPNEQWEEIQFSILFNIQIRHKLYIFS